MPIPLTTLLTNPLSAIIASPSLSQKADALQAFISLCIMQNTLGFPPDGLAGSFGNTAGDAPGNSQPSVQTTVNLCSAALLTRWATGL